MKKHIKLTATSILLASSLMLTNTWASDCQDAPGVNLRAVSSEAVVNDQVRMHWRAEIEENSSSDAMKGANRTLKKAIAQIERQAVFRNVQTNVQTYPVHGKQRTITHWRAVGSLSFELELSELEDQREIELAEPLALNRIEYFLGEQAIETSRAKLLKQAMKEFQTKAGLVADGFAHSGYQLAQIRVNDEAGGGQGPRPPVMRAMSASPESSMSPADVAVSGGVSTMSVSVDGLVCLKR